MRINQNISAMNTHASMVKADSAMSKSLERLSSGYRINRAADDAAGLAISEKMRGQISGLKQASKNAQDGISLLQTAEGNLNESHSILQRMRELADQAANGTVTDSDRAEIQKEMNQLTKEVDRIAKDTEFNTMKLLRGQTAAVGLSGSTPSAPGTGAMAGGVAAANASGSIDFAAVSLADGDKINIDGQTFTMVASGGAAASGHEIVNSGTQATMISNISAALTAAGITNSVSGTAIDLTAAGTAGNGTVSVTDSADVAKAGVTVTNLTGGVDAAAASGSLSINRQMAAGDTITFGTGGSAKTYTMVAAGTSSPTATQIVLGSDVAGTIANIVSKVNDATDGVSSITAAAGSDGKTINLTANATGTAGNLALATNLGAASQKADHITLTMQIGANAGQSMDVDVNNMDAGSLGIGRDANGVAVSGGIDATQGLDVTSSTSASNALTAIDNAINKVSSERSKLGAYQNRLDHTVSNLSTAAENLSASESRIRDVDMADEMSNFSRAQILMQASTAMMAQANQKPQAVLKLLG
ncbi:MAG TPA: flagellin [Bacillota bacterium]|nr:flagellin [Bacillota bacterium]